MKSGEQFVTLQAGQYWQARTAVEDEEIQEGDVLLIQSVRDVEKEAHTVILRPHPRWYAAHPHSDGEHRFLVKDFLEKFDPCPDYKRIRSAELAEVQGRVSNLQRELAEISSNPDAMKEVVSEGLRKWEKEQKLLPGTVENLPPPTPNAALDTSLTTDKIETMKLSMAKAGEIAKIQAEHIKGKVEEIGETVKAMTPFYKEQAAAALAMTEDVRTHVAKLMTGIASLDLYVGTNVHVKQISKGKEAPDGPDGEHLPLTIMQRRLYMDEELSAWADVDEKFDFNSDKKFFETIRKYKSLANQIFPTERCIVCMATTRRDVDYGPSAWENAQKNEINKQVFLLIRNGENIHVVYSPVESHMRSPKLFPSEKDIDDIFRDTKWWGEEEGRRITYNDVKYTDKLSEHDAVAVHYKRFLILLAGLDHRENLFGTFYDEPKGMQFVSMLFQQKYMRFIHDAEDSSKMLPLEDKPKFAEWLAKKNEYLQSGSRVICMWRDVMNSTTAPGVCKYSGGYNYRDRWLAEPTESYGIKIAFREGKEIFVKCSVKRKVYGRYVDTHMQEFDAKVNLSKYREHYQVGYVCLDAVKADELEWYVHDRENRKDFLNYIRLFKTAVKYLREEEKQEAATRAKLAKALDDGKIATPEEAAKAIDTTIIAWRAAHRGELLASADNPIEFPKLLNQIWTVSRNVVLHTVPAEMTAAEWQQAERWAKERGLEPLRFVQSGKAQTVALYCAPKPEEEDNRLWPMAWVHRIVLARKKNGFAEQSRQWKVLLSVNAVEVMLHEWEGASTWFDRPTPVNKFSEKQAIFDNVANFEHNLTLFKPMRPEVWDMTHASWTAMRCHMMDKVSGRVVNPSCYVPFGLIWTKEGNYGDPDNQLKYLAVGLYDGAKLLYENAPDDKRKVLLLREYSEAYRMSKAARDRLTGKDSDYRHSISLFEFSVAKEPQPNGLCEFSATRLGTDDIKLDKLDKSVKKLIQESKKDQEGAQFWVPTMTEATNA